MKHAGLREEFVRELRTLIPWSSGPSGFAADAIETRGLYMGKTSRAAKAAGD
jgi:hypothetical protein